MATVNDEIKALISLLDDPDELIFDQIRLKIQSLGEEIIPVLEDAWEHEAYGILFQSRVENIIHNIQFDNVKADLGAWAATEEKDLLDGMLALAKYQYPEINEAEIRIHINKLEKDIWLEFHDGLTALEKLKVFNHIMFDVHGFEANKKHYHSPDNSFINRVLESKRGNPISLAILYLILSDRLDLPVYGVNLPRHFILAWGDLMDISVNEGDDAKILFYINPFSGGSVFGKSDIDAFLKELKLKPNPIFFLPCSNYDIMVRSMNNLIHSYDQEGHGHKAEEIRELQRIIKL
ncbi:MAG: transglutaminase-like domain-containing protein [Salibacteraceae bacterium]|nr:transglutaminase-like domain-containing protein [Salibacteraceae bacterium]|tara:strand:- start:2585 stop:3460 length:876 start_codon:yes stop_codon:yes gene_type:complete